MKTALRFALLFFLGLIVVPFVPLYVERTMLRSFGPGFRGDVITWGWKVCTLSTFWSNYQYLSREQSPQFWLTVNLGLAVLYASLLALGVDLFLTRRKSKI